MKTCIVALCFLMVCVSAFAKNNKSEKTPAQRTQELTLLLNLTPDQQTKVLALNNKYVKVLGHKPETMKKKSEDYARRKALRTAYRKQLSAVLTKSQRQKYDANSKAKKK